MKLIVAITIGLIVAGTLLEAQEINHVDDHFLTALRAEVAQHHPASRAASLRISAADCDVRNVHLWDDPMVGLSLRAASEEMRRSDGDLRFGLEQPLPKPGLFTATQTKARALGQAAREDFRTSSLEIQAAAARDGIELALADESISLQVAQIQWLSMRVANAGEIALDPKGSSIDVLRLQSELAKENQILEAARRTRDSLARRLNLRLGRSLESPWPVLRLSNETAAVPVAVSEIARIPRANPKVRALRAIATAAKAATRIADRESQPQLSIAIDTDLYSGGDFRSASFGLKMSLPVLNHRSYQANIDAAALREEAAVNDIEVARLEIAAAVLKAVSEATNAAAQARAYSGEIYQCALQAAHAVEDSWLSLKSPLTEVLEAQRILFAIRLEQRRFVAMRQVALEDLHLLVPNSP